MKFGKSVELNVLYRVTLIASKGNTRVKICSRSNLINANIFDLDQELRTGVSHLMWFVLKTREHVKL